MANPHPILPPNEATRFSTTNRPKKTNLLRDAHEMERLTCQRIREAPEGVESLTGYAALVRAFVALVDCIQRLRGVPLPGSLRPDLDPVQMARALKRAKLRQPIDILTLTEGKSKFYDEPEEEPAKVKVNKESLLDKTRGDGMTGEGGGKPSEAETEG